MVLSDNRPFTVIASDQGFLPAPVAVQQLSLAPGERREVLIDMSQGNKVSITAGTAAGIMDRLRGLFEPSSILTNTLVLTLRPTGLLPLVTDNLPMRLLADQILDGVATRTREFRIGDGMPGSSDHFPFVYYSQTLELADLGTAGQLLVQPTV